MKQLNVQSGEAPSHVLVKPNASTSNVIGTGTKFSCTLQEIPNHNSVRHLHVDASYGFHDESYIVQLYNFFHAYCK